MKSLRRIVAVLLVAVVIVGAFAACDAAHEHSFSEWVVTKEATCTAVGVKTKTCECGETETEEIAIVAHIWADATCTAPKTCSVCKATEGEALGHTWVDATFNDPKTCSVCAATEGEAKEVFPWLRDYIKANGDEAHGSYALIMFAASDILTYLWYDPDTPNQITMFHYGYSSSGYSMSCSFVLDSEMSGVYSWKAVDSYDNYMYGTVQADKFTQQTQTLYYNRTSFSSNAMGSVSSLAATALYSILLEFNLYFDDYGLMSWNLGFDNY